MPSALLPIRTAVIDFDGTICPEDVSEELLKVFASPEWWDIDLEFQRGLIGSRECLIRQGALLKGAPAELLTYVLAHHSVEPTFPPFVEWAASVGIQVIVASDGFGFYVLPMLEAAGVRGVTVVANTTELVPSPPRFSFPNGHPVCVGCGVCKMNVVLAARERNGPVAFVGEGHTDRYGALYSELVFAKKDLVEICRADGVPSLPWETFDDVRTGLEETKELPAPVAPDRCPGWTLPPGLSAEP